MKVTVPDEWARHWEHFDRVAVIVKEADHLSAIGVGQIMRIGLDRPPRQHPAFCAWMAVRWGVGTYNDLITALWDERDTEDEERAT